MSTLSPVFAQALPGGTLDPLAIPKYVTPLVIPPEMPKSTTSPAPAANYDIAVRQFKQQILPGGIWGSVFSDPTSTTGGTIGPFPATTVWSYGRAEDPIPDSSGIGGAAGVAPAMNSSFNYPAFTVEAATMQQTSVRWINDLVDSAGNYLPHLFNVDQTLHWANPPKANCVMMPDMRTDCETAVAAPYTGPVPLVTHLHGAHVQPHSDGYPEAWWLPGAPGTKGIPATYAERGTHFTQADNTNTVPGSAFYSYENTQPATTLWYHDHALGMTRLNVYAGPAGFWLIRGGANDLASGLPGPAPKASVGDPNFNAAVRAAIREVPLAIQDRSFNSDGSLFYPADRSFFDGFTGPYIGGAGTPTGPSDISGIWNPEAFFNTMVVNGTTWPKYEVAPARYRLRLLNGCNSRTLNLSLSTVTSLGTDSMPGTADDVLGTEVPFYQIGAEQGFLPQVVKIQTGQYTVLPGDGSIPASVAAPDPSQALLMMPAERADVIVDFTGLPNGTRIRMINTAPDAPFGGFPDVAADPLTTGQVMDFVVNDLLSQPTDTATTPVENLVLPAEAPLGAATNTRQLSLNELMSDQVCVRVDAVTGAITFLFSRAAGDPTFMADCAAAPGEPMGPRQARMGIVTTSGANLIAVSKKWGDGITETPFLNSTEIWELYNTTADAHPVHVHLVAFEVVNRQNLDPNALIQGNLVVTGPTITPNPNEMGYKDTVVAFPGQVTRIKAKFDIAGLYVWHCHIVEHEDNEMMRPFIVITKRPNADFDSDGKNDIAVWRPSDGNWFIISSSNGMQNVVNYGTNGDIPVLGDYDGDGKPDIAVWRSSDGNWFIKNTSTGVENVTNYGTTGDISVPGDYDGDGKTDIAVWRSSDGNWFIINSATGMQNVVNFGTSGDIPVPGDYDGDGKTDIAVWRSSDGNWFVINSATGMQNVINYGTAGDIPVPGDYDGDGKTDLAVWRSSDGNWFVKNSATGTESIVNYGTTGDSVVPADYDGDGKTDIAVWRSSDGNWFVKNSSTGMDSIVNWGAAGDQPVR
ncbi:MAG: FG-GAP-like repeat-containing protein [Nitrospirota bacterium]